MPLQISSLLSEDERAHLSESAIGGQDDGCWLPRRHQRVIWVVIDALRFDFARWSDDGGIDGPTAFYHNKLPVLHEVLQAGRGRGLHSGNDTAAPGGRAMLYKFEADPPTVTMQRLKGLTTGALPTFIDFRNNFHSPQIEEDNWVQQAAALGMPLVFMGDDTWASLFPSQFQRAFPFPSFNTRDLHTVDDGVLARLPAELAARDWRVLVAHFLGVDHVGHTHGPATRAMADKLAQMDAALRAVLAAADAARALVLVMGDHGMTEDGNHGGATAAETDAALLLGGRGAGGGVRSGGVREARGAAFQVDLVPTLSLLMGLPIPFGSLGGVLPELFAGPYAHERQPKGTGGPPQSSWRYNEADAYGEPRKHTYWYCRSPPISCYHCHSPPTSCDL
ncbi:alkaline-phosphatase-like protein [Tribonema minus]|uniref:Alkaline-phosphatase-like protein n=1 Tax=Tribonema minus TaxID=303371 RepID=A0A836CFR5_9STRA|nr:alkaline-phosphatase-like protein [Tribonema minus]